MATRNVVARANEEGNIGTALKNWLKGWFKDVYVSNTLTDGSNTATIANLKDAVDKKHLEAHSIASHDDTTATGAELETLTDTSNADSLHKHDQYALDTDLSTHESDTTSIHGITNTNDLGLKSGNVNQFNDITSAGADIEDAVTKKHDEAHILNSHTDVDFDSGTPADNDVLTYDSGTGKWKAEASAGGGAEGTRGTFDNGDLTAGVLTITHSSSLSTGYTLNVTIANDSQQMVIPDNITFLTDTILVDLSSFGSISGTWGSYYI